MPIRLAIADDHAVLRQALGALLEGQTDMIVVGQASNGAELVELVDRERPDVVILDLTMPGGGGLGALRSIRERGSDARCLVLSMHDEPSTLHRVLEAGGDGYVTKRASTEELLHAIRSVASGGAYFSVGMSERGASAANLERLTALSQREREVFERVARGFTSKEIAAELGIQQTTVDVYRSRLMKKLGVSSRAELVELALDAGVMTGPGQT